MIDVYHFNRIDTDTGVIHAMWINVEGEFDYRGFEYTEGNCRCSYCNRVFYNHSIDNYCRNCGAIMDLDKMNKEMNKNSESEFGQWSERKLDRNFGFWYIQECSKCHNEAPAGHRFPYCPYCGCKMKLD